VPPSLHVKRLVKPALTYAGTSLTDMSLTVNAAVFALPVSGWRCSFYIFTFILIHISGSVALTLSEHIRLVIPLSQCSPRLMPAQVLSNLHPDSLRLMWKIIDASPAGTGSLTELEEHFQGVISE